MRFVKNIVFLFLVIFLLSAGAEAKEVRLFLDKFAVHADSDNYNYLVSGIDGLLQNSLGSIKDLSFVKGENEAEFVVKGSVIIMGKTSITSAFVEKNGKRILTFNRKGKNDSSVLSQVYEFSNLAVKSISGPGKSSYVSDAALPAPASAEPEKKKKRGAILFSSKRLGEYIKSIAACDFNKDGSAEMVWLNESELVAGRIKNGKLKRKSSQKLENSLSKLTIETIGDEKPLIIVNQYDKNNLRFSASGFYLKKDFSFEKVKIHENSFYRSFFDATGKKHILAREGGIKGDLFYGDIKEVSFDGKINFKNFDIGKNFKFFPSFSSGIFTDSGKKEYAVIRDGRLKIYSDSWENIWEAVEKAGSTMKYIDIPPRNRNSNFTRYFIEPRFIPLYNRGKRSSILFSENIDAGNNLFQRIRSFKTSKLKAFSWGDLSMEDVYSSPELHGWISDFALYDMDGDGRDDIIISNPEKLGTFSSKVKSRIIVLKFLEK